MRDSRFVVYTNVCAYHSHYWITDAFKVQNNEIKYKMIIFKTTAFLLKG